MLDGITGLAVGASAPCLLLEGDLALFVLVDLDDAPLLFDGTALLLGDTRLFEALVFTFADAFAFADTLTFTDPFALKEGLLILA